VRERGGRWGGGVAYFRKHWDIHVVGRPVVMFETVIGEIGRMSSNAAAVAVTQTSLFHNTPLYHTNNVNKCECI